MPDYNVTITLLTGAVLNDTITGATNLADALSTAVSMTTSSQSIPDVREGGYNNLISATEAVNYSPYIIGSIHVEEDV
jgi:hypothetical protein